MYRVEYILNDTDNNKLIIGIKNHLKYYTKKIQML